MKIETLRGKLRLDDADGRPISLTSKSGREYIYDGKRALITIWLLDGDGNYTQAVSADSKMSAETCGNRIVLTYIGFNGLDLDAVATVEEGEDGFFQFGLRVENRTGLILESIDYPCVTVPNDLKAGGGDGYLFWPAMEGVQIDDLSIKEACGIRYRSDPFPAYGWDGHYPGACQMQFSAYYNDDGCLYFAAHDNQCNPKVIELEPIGTEGVRLQYRMFPGQPYETVYELPYPMILGLTEGNWYDAAEIYRRWLLGSGMIKLPRFKDNGDFPAWLQESPVVVMYAAMGEENTSRIREEVYYPYTKGVPYLQKLADTFDSKVLALLCHWESTAPWAPPYMWPPYGDIENFRSMISQLHNDGHHIGLYCSGTAWTQQSGLREEYIREDEFERDRLDRFMQVGPTHKLEFSKVCGWPIRRGYDMCPATEFAKQVSVNEVCSITRNLDVDYLQFFDQNIGGNSYPCYAENHGHPPVPGKWLNESMCELIDRMYAETAKTGKKIMIGCEGNAAEPFVNQLLFNDSRHNIGYFVGTPVSAYNYVFHEYFNNFMGNQNTSHTIIDHTKNPENTYYRVAHGFAQGDFLTVVMKNDGKINRDCCTPWELPDLDQEDIGGFICELNAWRKGFAREALFFGRMVKPLEVRCGRYRENINYGGKHDFPTIVTECYELENGSRLQVLVNYMTKAQTVQVKLPGIAECTVVTDSKGVQQSLTALNDGALEINMPRRSVRALVYELKV